MITTYQIRNVLRIYGNQLKKRTMLMQENPGTAKQPPDVVNISNEARKKQMYDQISNNIVTQITQNQHQPVAQASIIED